jgi:hypothetical protein
VTEPVKDPRVGTPPCPVTSCRAPAGSTWCVTPTGFRRHMHTVRRRMIDGAPAPAAKPAGSLVRRRPTRPQAGLLAVAVTGPAGEVEVSGYTFSGDAQRRAAMAAMTDPARGWFTYVRSTAHCEVYAVTDAGRAAWRRYEDWMEGTG